MRRLALLTALALGGLLALAGPAAAHVEVGSTDATPGGYAVVSLRVPTESATASTVKVEVKLPVVGSVAVRPTPGWTFTTTTAKLPKPITTDDGPVTSAVSQITWTATAGGTKPGEYEQFDISIGPLPHASTVAFPTIQHYSDGTSVQWIERAAPGSKAEPEHPVPTLTLSKAGGDAPAPAKVEQASTTAPTVLSIVALVVAAAALGLAVVSRARNTQAAP